MPHFNTVDAFRLTQDKIKEYQLLADKNNTEARIRLYEYYNFSKQNFNQVMRTLQEGAKLGDPVFQYKFARHLIYGVHLNSYITQNKNNYELGIFWLKQAAHKGYKPAIDELKNLDSDRPDLVHLQ